MSRQSQTTPTEHDFGVLAAAWHDVELVQSAAAAQQVAEWTKSMQAMVADRDELIRSGRWRGGPRTLLGALGVEAYELKMTAGLAWLLRPDGHHGAGAAVLAALMSRLGISGLLDPSRVRVQVEETRGGDTRADLVVYGPGWTMVVEAKVFAPEGPQQLARLHELWRDDPDPTFVFLTRGRRQPSRAGLTTPDWVNITWHEIARLVQAAVEPVRPSPGVLDYVATLEAYHHD